MAAMMMKKPGLLLAETWDGDQDISGWWLSEKLDGVRAYWDGSTFLSRDGNPFHAPAWFTAGLPSFALDGELWVDRRQFQKTVGIVRRQNGGDAWRQVRYVIFDAPGFGGPFEHRQFVLRNSDEWQPTEFAYLLDQQRCTDTDHLLQVLAVVTDSLGGEGLMLRQPGSRYHAGRSPTLLKVKRFHDAEARVISHEQGSGRNAARLGAIVCQTANGVQFCIGTGFTDDQRDCPPPIGSIVTFRYQELTAGGVPRFPAFLRLHEKGQSSP